MGRSKRRSKKRTVRAAVDPCVSAGRGVKRAAGRLRSVAKQYKTARGQYNKALSKVRTKCKRVKGGSGRGFGFSVIEPAY